MTASQIESRLTGDQRDDTRVSGAQSGHQGRDALVTRRIAGLVDVDGTVPQDSQDGLGPILKDGLLDELSG